MIAVEVPKDLSKVKHKFIGPFTKRQCLFLTLAALVGVPVYYLAQLKFGGTLAGYLMMIVSMPFLAAGFIDKDGKPITSFLIQKYNFLLVRKMKRPYISENIYDQLLEYMEMKKEFKGYATQLIQKKSTRAESKLKKRKNTSIKSRKKKDI